MQTPWKRIGVAAVAALAIVAFSGSANAQRHHHGGGYYGGGGGFGPGIFLGGLAAGAVLGGGYYGGPYGYYDGGPYGYYGGGPYAYGGGCYIERQVVINRSGHRVIRRVRVCD